MIETNDKTKIEHNQQRIKQLQRRIIRLLLQHDTQLLRKQFRLFFADSELPEIPLLQQYDRYIKLRLLSNELLDYILPNIRRQLSMKTDHLRLHEEPPTRGDIDWHRTIERSWNSAPGQPPQSFETRLRQRNMETPENILAVAILLAYRQELQAVRQDLFTDEELNQQELRTLIGADERAERELAAAYARTLLAQAKQASIDPLLIQVAAQLRPGPNPYRDLINWWQCFTQFRIGRMTADRALTLSSVRTDEKVDAWLYELWIALEFLHLLHAHGSVEATDTQIATDLLQYTFSWQGQRYRLLYNRQLDTSTSYQPDWLYGPATRPDYTIEREKPLEILHDSVSIWREPSVLLDAKYYVSGSDPTNTHAPLKKLLGDMTLLGAHTGMLFFPQLPEPIDEQQSTRIVRRTARQYHPHEPTPQIHLYHLDPMLPFDILKARLTNILNVAIDNLPQRPTPICQGTWLDPDNINASHHVHPPCTVICPKAHIGPHSFDLVNAATDCLRNPHVCHVIGQDIIPPYVDHKVPPTALTLNTPYNSGMLTVTVQAYRRRRPFRPILNRFEPGWKLRGQPETWFIELDCIIKNRVNREIYIWGQLDGILTDDAKPHTPHVLRQFPPLLSLRDDDSLDMVPGSHYAVQMKQSVMVKGAVESKFFFKIDESMNIHTMTFSLHFSRTTSGPFKQQPPLFIIDASKALESSQ